MALSLTNFDLGCTIQTFMDKNEIFSAFQITLAMQQNGYDVLHRNIKNDIHKIVDSLLNDYPNYTKTSLVKFNKKIVVYHPYNIDPYDIQIVTKTHTDTNKKSYNTSIYDKRGRFTIPTAFIKDAKLYKICYIERKNDKLYISSIFTKNQCLATLYVTKPLRISRKIIKLVFGKIPDSIEITSEIDNNCIYLKDND